MKKQFLMVCLLLLFVVYPAYGTEVLDPIVTIATNPAKLFMGLPNLEFEYRFTTNVSVCVFTEFLVWDSVVTRDMHPDLVVRLGPRYYFGGTKAKGFYSGLSIGYTWSQQRSELTNETLGGELGYRINLWESFFIQPRGLVTYSMGGKVVPGGELLGGVRF